MSTLLFLLLAAAHAGEAPPIVNGTAVDPGDWEDAAGVAFGFGDVQCTGVLVAPRVVLTAGHCAGPVTHVLLGSVDFDSNQGEWISVVDQISHPNPYYTYDIAVLILERDSVYEPRTILPDCAVDQLSNGVDVTIAGYGAIDEWGNQYTSKMQQGITQIQDHDCSDAANGCNSAVSPGGELGAGGTSDACFGDSGGPLYLDTPWGTYLAGITSRGYSWVSVPCRDGGIYVRPDAVRDWIEDVSGTTLPAGRCNDAPDPSAEILRIQKNTTGTVQVMPNDPDVGDDHSFTIVTPPLHGTATIDDEGLITYTPDRGYRGGDSVWVEVTDLGTPPLSAELAVEINVLRKRDMKEGGGACMTGIASSSVTGVFFMGALAWLGRRRRQEA